jgi:hypothetical protein
VIGHVFASSNAICLAIAPHAKNFDEYVVLARHDNGYAVAQLPIANMPSPRSWAHGAYYNDDDLDEAIAQFLADTELTGSAALMRRRIECAEGQNLPRVLPAASDQPIPPYAL